MSWPHTEQVDQLRATSTVTDRGGNPVKVWSPVAALDVAIGPGAGEDLTDAHRDGAQFDYTLYLFPGQGIQPGDRFRVRDQICAIVGTPVDWAGSGTVVHVKTTKG